MFKICSNGGRIVFQGPRLDALLYFERLGYFKPQHVEVADYLMVRDSSVKGFGSKEAGIGTSAHRCHNDIPRNLLPLKRYFESL